VDSLQLAIENLTSPPVVAFALGALAVVVRSDLRLPDPIHTGLATYLLLVLFLLDLGATAASRLREHRSLTPPVVAFGLVTPLILGATGVAVGTLAGLSPGGAAVFGAMAASASYIAAPAAVRVALPSADGALSIGLSLGVTFPFNLAIGIPLYLELARAIG